MKSREPFKDGSIIIGQDKAERYNNALKAELRGAKTEEDVRLATYTFLRNLTKEVGVNVKMQNEKVVLTGGRIDSLFDNIVFEFKKPFYFKKEGGIKESINGRKEKGGLIEYLVSIAIDESTNLEDFLKNLSTKIGIGFDGKSFIFVRYVYNVNKEIKISHYKNRMAEKCPSWIPDHLDGIFEASGRRDIKNGLRFLFLYLRSISPRAPLTPENVSRRFGEQSYHFKKHLKIIYSLLSNRLKEKNTHVETLYGEWDRVFGKVYGDINTSTSDIKHEITEKYREKNGFSGNEIIDMKMLIFSIHTYYNIILKLLVSNLFSTLLNPFSTQKTILTLNDEKFKKRVIATLHGESFKNFGIENFFETGFFEWWIYVWNDGMSEMLREVIALLEELEVTTSVTKPELIADMVKETYHSLMPQALRHLLGEYFTPDWLSEFAVDTSGFTGKLEETFLDTACGSGTFLTIAIRKKILYNEGTERKTIIKKILSTVVGFDLNPISVIASKTNYLLALGDLSELDFTVKIPVYQCDSILTPTVHATQKEESSTFKIDTICGTFEVPALKTRDEIENILDTIGLAIKNNFKDDEFLRKIKINHSDIDEDVTIKLFRKIKKLTKINKNGLWIPILKNSFAPVYSENQFDFVVGNPPWVSWKSMSKSYRELTLPIWLSYDIFNKTAYDKKTTHDDFAMAFTYVSADHYLKMAGKLCFVISQSFFKSKKGGEGFRKFEITRDNVRASLKVEKVVDMVAIKPFNEVTNRTSVMLLKKGEKTKYPVPYYVWTPKEKIKESDTLTEVNRKVEIAKLIAIPIGGVDNEKSLRTPWLTLPENEMEKIRKAIGKSAYKGRKRLEPLGAKGVYLLKEPRIVRGKRVQICNLLARGRLKEVKKMGEYQGLIEDTFVYPLISGRNIDRYGINSFCYVLMPHEKKKGVHNAITEEDLKVKYTATYEWLSYFRKVLFDTRKRNSKFFDENKDPFYFLDNIGIYTFSPWKVVWREQNKNMISCVVSDKSTMPLKGKLIIPDSKVLFCPLYNKYEAHYLCAMLNSKPVTDIIEGYTLELQRGIDILENIKISKYNENIKLHHTLSLLSQKAHNMYPGFKSLAEIQKKIDSIVLRLLF